MEQHTFENVNSCWNTQITFYLETLLRVVKIVFDI